MKRFGWDGLVLAPTGSAAVPLLPMWALLFSQMWSGTRLHRHLFPPGSFLGAHMLCSGVYSSWDKKHGHLDCEPDFKPMWSTPAEGCPFSSGVWCSAPAPSELPPLPCQAGKSLWQCTPNFHTELSSGRAHTQDFCIELALKQYDYHLGLFWQMALTHRNMLIK